MRLLAADGTDLWLAYGMNVHPGGDLAATEAALREVVGPLRGRLGARGPFGLSLRFDAPAVDRLHADPGGCARLAARLAADDLVPFTANAFVVGTFHGRPVKEAVYAPPWSDPRRLAYTVRFAEVLARLAGPARRLSLSTAPGSWRGWGAGAEVDRASAVNVAEAGRLLERLSEERGADVRLGLEPEPGCTVETLREAVAFFVGPLAEALAGDDRARSRLGVCLDACHAAVTFEDLGEALADLAAAQVPVVKVQASCALEVPDPGDPRSRAALARFAEPTWLHQVGWVEAGGVRRLLTDLPLALEHADAGRGAGGEPGPGVGPWRVHFHVPVFREEMGEGLRTTRPLLDRLLARVAAGGVCDHLEIETYTWSALPGPGGGRGPEGAAGLVEGLAREYEHVLRVLAREGARPASEAGR